MVTAKVVASVLARVSFPFYVSIDNTSDILSIDNTLGILSIDNTLGILSIETSCQSIHPRLWLHVYIHVGINILYIHNVTCQASS